MHESQRAFILFFGEVPCLDRNVALNYVKRKKRKKRAALISLFSSIGITIMIIIAFCIIIVDRFTITTSQQYLSLTIDENKQALTTSLHAPPLLKATDTQYSDIPENIDEGLGSKNTNSYFAYSFYLIGGSDLAQEMNYSLTMTLKVASNALEDAVRVMIIKDGCRTVYAQPNDDGSSKLIYYAANHSDEPQIIGATVPFKNNKHIILEPYKIKPGVEQKYTIVMWIDGWDSVNEMKGGTFNSELKFQILSNNEVN